MGGLLAICKSYDKLPWTKIVVVLWVDTDLSGKRLKRGCAQFTIIHEWC